MTKNTQVLVIGILVLVFCVASFLVILQTTPVGSDLPSANEIIKERIPADNPYDPEVQPGRYSNYILTHPTPTGNGDVL